MYRTEIRIKGKLNENWSDWFDGMKIHFTTGGDTLLTGDLSDKSAIYGVLSKLSNLGVDLICLTCTELASFEPQIES